MASSFPKTILRHDSRKVQISKSFCLSYRWNVRNLERLWYGHWNTTLLHLTESFENMIVVPQFPLWFRPEDEESDVEDDEGAASGRSDGEDELNLFLYEEERDPDEHQSVVQDEWKMDDDRETADASCLELEEANLTTDSLVTLPGDAAELFPDFVIIHLLAKRLPRYHPRFERLSGLRITHQCCPVVMEIKRHPSCRLRGSDFRRALIPFLNQAKSDLAYQCYHLFEQYPHAVSTIAMAAAGDYWTHLTVYRHHVPSPVGDLLDISIWDTLDWPDYVVLGTAESNMRLGEIHDALARKPHLDLAE
jgi:hypothetical protein